MGRLFSWAPREFLLGGSSGGRKEAAFSADWAGFYPHCGQGMGFSLLQSEGKNFLPSCLIPPMALEVILPLAKVRSHRRAGDGVIYKLPVSCLEVAVGWEGLFLSSNTRKWPIVYTGISLIALEKSQTH